MKKIQTQLVHRVYALLLLGIMALSVLPVKLLHQHSGISIPTAQQDSRDTFQHYDGAYCALCLHQFIQHYIPSVFFSETEVNASFFVRFYIDQSLFSSPNKLPQLRGPPFSV